MQSPTIDLCPLLDSAVQLRNLIEGVGCVRWASPNGFRLKDTPEWVAFYVRLANLEDFMLTRGKTRAQAMGELLEAARNLNRIISGPGSVQWGYGPAPGILLKNTLEWTKFKAALGSVERTSPDGY